jgi:hypothetical protein
MKRTLCGALLVVLFASQWASAQPSQPQPGVSSGQQNRMELMKSKGTETSLTIFPTGLPGTPLNGEFRVRVSEVIGVLLEKQGLKNIELAKAEFDPAGTNSMEHMAASFGGFIRTNNITTDYALYAEYHGDMQKHRFDGLRAIVVDKTGAVVWTDFLTLQDEALQKVEDPDPMGFSVLLGERLSPKLGLNEETAKAAKPGRLAALMDERSGMPKESERAPLPERQKEMRESRGKLSLMIFPARIGGESVDAERATHLAQLINDKGLCKAAAAKESVLLKSSMKDPNELKALWTLAKDFRNYVRSHPIDADYALYADYVFDPKNWEQGIVHFVVCNRKGEWVIVDMQNSQHDDYRSVKPTSKEACDTLLVKRLEGYLTATDQK